MNHTRPDNPHEGPATLADHLYRVTRRSPGAQRDIRAPAGLAELRDTARALLQDLEPGAFRLNPSTVQHFVTRPTDVWAAA